MEYKDIYIGQKESIEHTITQSDIEKFVELSGDDNKLHVDKDFAAKTSFKKPVVHGMIGASFISTLIGTKLPGDGALWYSQTLEFILPARVGDKITIIATVISKCDRENSIELKTEIINQNRAVITRGVSKVKVVEVTSPQVIAIPKIRKKVALVLGATGGIGEATCMKLSELGYDIAVHYKSSRDKAEALCKKFQESCKYYIFQADLTKDEDVKKIIEIVQRRLGDITFFVNCASLSIPLIKMQDLEWNDFDRQLEINIKQNFEYIKNLVPFMAKNKYGKIVLIGSVVVDKPENNYVHYATAKSALEGFAKSIAFELAPLGINVNMVSASMLDTMLNADIPLKIKLLTAAQTPMRRLATPKDIAGAIGFLASDDSNFLSGEVIRVNGGQVMK